jgi:uncharacterized protein (DUF362 family)
MKRRVFLRKSFLIGAGFTFLPASRLFPLELVTMPSTSRVVEINSPNIRTGMAFNSAILEQLLDQGLSQLYQTENPQSIWNNLFSKKDVVGIKVNCLSGEKASTHKLLVEIITERLQKCGVSPGNIIIWDRMNKDLESAGYSINQNDKNKIRCFGNDAAGFADRLYVNGSVGSLITRILTDLCTAVINVPVLKDHGIVGITLSMKNYFGAIHNPNKYHHQAGNPYVADLYEIPLIRQKTRLTICDALDAQYEGGPPFKPQWTWPMNSLLLAVDGVALDRVGWEIIENKRKEMNQPPLKEIGRNPEYILTAGKKNLGQSDLSLVDWQKIMI